MTSKDNGGNAEKYLSRKPVTIRSVSGTADKKKEKKILRVCFLLRLLHHITYKIEPPLLGNMHS